jgi:molybdenum cofactor guanylyltransferase
MKDALDTDTTGIILCGGRGRRVADSDKPLLSYAGRRLIEWVFQALEPQVQSLLISANRNLEVYRQYAPVITDDKPGYHGPLEGIASCLRRVDSTLTFVAPGDCPHLAAGLVTTLARALGNADAAIAHDGQRTQPLHMLLRTSTVNGLEDFLQSEDHSVRGWTATLKTVEVDCSHIAASFRNVNTPEDFA